MNTPGVWITGPSRGGTSMTAGALRACGVFFGETVPPNRICKKGSVESSWLKLNFKRFGSQVKSWPNWPKMFVDQLASEGWQGEPWGAKTGPERWPLFAKCGPAVIVVCQRKIEDVVASRKRWGGPFRKGGEEVVRTAYERIETVRREATCPIIDIDVDALAAGDYPQLEAALEHLGLSLDEAAVADWIDPGLWSGSVPAADGDGRPTAEDPNTADGEQASHSQRRRNHGNSPGKVTSPRHVASRMSPQRRHAGSDRSITAAASQNEADSALRIALLCPGQSLTEFPGKEAGGYDLVLAVNRAAEHTPCDYWVMCDADAFARCTPQPNSAGEQPTIVTSRDQHRLMVGKFGARDYEWRNSQQGFRRWPGKRIAWHRFSSTTALGVALQLRDSGLGTGDSIPDPRSPIPSAVIDCYGVDWRGEADWDGTTSTSDRRDEGRWSQERELFSAVCAALVEHNIEVQRHPTAE